MNRSPWRLEEVNGSPWRLEEVDGGDEQYLVESSFAVRHTPSDEQDPCFDLRRSVSSVLWYATPLPINRTPVSTVGGPFCLFCSTPDPLPMNRTPVSTVGGLFRPFCGTPHSSRSTGPPFRP